MGLSVDLGHSDGKEISEVELRMLISSKQVTIGILAIIILIWTLFPMYMLTLSTLKTRLEVTIPSLTVKEPTLFWWQTVLFDRENLASYRNSFIASGGAALLGLALGLPAAYACSRFKFKGRNDLLFMILSFRFLPPACMVIPMFMLGKTVGLLDSPILTISLYASANIPIIVWVMMSYINEIPQELEESYMIDGHTRLQAFFKVTLPLVKTGLIAVTLLCIALTFGEFLFAALLTSSATAKTLPVSISEYMGGELGWEWGIIATLTMYGLIPLMVIFVLIRKHLVRGLTFGVVR